MTENQALPDRITVDPDVMVGKPVVRGTRVPVELVLGFLAARPALGELFAAYPHLTVDDVKACLAYARLAIVVSRRTARVRET
jgi:uncharacterized protein (DUF433 family)